MYEITLPLQVRLFPMCVGSSQSGMRSTQLFVESVLIPDWDELVWVVAENGVTELALMWGCCGGPSQTGMNAIARTMHEYEHTQTFGLGHK